MSLGWFGLLSLLTLHPDVAQSSSAQNTRAGVGVGVGAHSSRVGAGPGVGPAPPGRHHRPHADECMIHRVPNQFGIEMTALRTLSVRLNLSR